MKSYLDEDSAEKELFHCIKQVNWPNFPIEFSDPNYRFTGNENKTEALSLFLEKIKNVDSNYVRDFLEFDFSQEQFYNESFDMFFSH
ncbi:hypothetical protein [Photorhabdus cinerea]|uniref:Uncharacterized protein n=1 Tax=Photorhabdus cinerea TaxID=471575 RepID=A0A7X5TIY1_9GAMM|nr:hypothetical protein [Photorhabdus cinerea]NHB93377.1 hypothetical protein [Photorhabdus cinerea]